MEREFSQLLFYFPWRQLYYLYSSSVWQALASQRRINLATDLQPFNFADVSILLFNLCSTSDAIIGKSLSTLFPISSVGFLILGPMLDIKTYILKQYMPTSFYHTIKYNDLYCYVL